MARSFYLAVFPFVLLIAAMLVGAAPLVNRQIGDLQCNIDRLGIVADLTKLSTTVKSLTTSLASDATNAPIAQAAQDGVTGAQGAIKTIAAALFTGQTAPADARDQVAGNLTAIGAALGNITSTDSTVTASVQKAQTQLSSAVTAGEGVVSNCS
ncbi:hypothetical protein A0H81_03138 [Grifola frondosa]|uniref:Uncharacterized protein n=1 Tax=Grifola frondosa TaxID=5627 RepID=A0A1C7MKQ0_GRIFR|nr:hypothetical protein A0H81_03138 [Grifola frondosa]